MLSKRYAPRASLSYLGADEQRVELGEYTEHFVRIAGSA